VAKAPAQASQCAAAAPAEPLEEAFARWQDELLGTLFYLVGNREDARDALQEAFIKCWRHRQQLPRIENLKAWIFRIALNTGRDLRESAWRRKRQALPEHDVMIDTHQAAPADQAAANEDVERVREAIGALRQEEQEVFLLRQNGDLTYEEIAGALQIPVGTVKTRMRMALAHLRQAMVVAT
jgi:RNA polymerase sigma-70 factor (ECF subfamily)